MSLRKNAAGQIVTFVALDADGEYVTGDAANISASVIQDGTRSAAANAVAEVDATNAPGRYRLLLTQAETNYDSVDVAAISATSGVQVLAPLLGPTLVDLTAAEVNAQVDTALADYDGPTKAEMDSAVAGVTAVPTLGPFTATGTPTLTTVTCEVSATNTDEDYFPQAANDGAARFLIVQSGDRKGEMARIASSTVVGTTLTLTFDAMKAAMDAGDTFRVGGR